VDTAGDTRLIIGVDIHLDTQTAAARSHSCRWPRRKSRSAKPTTHGWPPPVTCHDPVEIMCYLGTAAREPTLMGGRRISSSRSAPGPWTGAVASWTANPPSIA
jgi:hypothetical protein